MSQLVTGEAVSLDLRPAALPSRVVAGLVDGLLQLVVLLVLGFVTVMASLNASDAAAAALSIVLIVVVLIVYPVTFETLMRGRTPGKAAMGLRVVRDDGGPIGFRQAFVRGLAGAFLERPGITVFVAGVVTMLLNEQGKRLGDLLAGTVVVRERVAVQGGSVAMMPPQLAGWAAQLDLNGLDDDLAMSMRQLVSRADSLTPAAREDLGRRLVGAVTQAVGEPPPGTPGWAVLSAVLAERRRREEQRLAARHGMPGAGAPHYPPPQYPQVGPAGRQYPPPPGGYAPSPRPSVQQPPPTQAPSEQSPPPATPGGFVPPA